MERYLAKISLLKLLFIHVTDCNMKSVPYLLPTTAKRSSTRRDKAHSVRLFITGVHLVPEK